MWHNFLRAGIFDVMGFSRLIGGERSFTFGTVEVGNTVCVLTNYPAQTPTLN